MIFEPVQFTDRRGRSVVLRRAEVSDAEALIRYLKVTAGETPFLLHEPDEISVTPEQEEKFLREIAAAPRELMLLAFVDGVHAGNCSCTAVGGSRRHGHRCSIGIALYQAFCGAGIGRRMLEEILAAAKAAGYEQAELEVFAANTGAVALYRSLGFQQYGVFPDNARYDDGRYGDACWMMKKL